MPGPASTSRDIWASARLGHYREALRLIRERNPLPVVCGRVCVRKCEAACRRNLVDASVGINQVKRFVSGHASVHPERLPPRGSGSPSWEAARRA